MDSPFGGGFLSWSQHRKKNSFFIGMQTTLKLTASMWILFGHIEVCHRLHIEMHLNVFVVQFSLSHSFCIVSLSYVCVCVLNLPTFLLLACGFVSFVSFWHFFPVWTGVHRTFYSPIELWIVDCVFVFCAGVFPFVCQLYLLLLFFHHFELTYKLHPNGCMYSIFISVVVVDAFAIKHSTSKRIGFIWLFFVNIRYHKQSWSLWLHVHSHFLRYCCVFWFNHCNGIGHAKQHKHTHTYKRNSSLGQRFFFFFEIHSLVRLQNKCQANFDVKEETCCGSWTVPFVE